VDKIGSQNRFFQPYHSSPGSENRDYLKFDMLAVQNMSNSSGKAARGKMKLFVELFDMLVQRISNRRKKGCCEPVFLESFIAHPVRRTGVIKRQLPKGLPERGRPFNKH
jgi:hypothetical protein